LLFKNTFTHSLYLEYQVISSYQQTKYLR
jgi:hypothetical protein